MQLRKNIHKFLVVSLDQCRAMELTTPPIPLAFAQLEIELGPCSYPSRMFKYMLPCLHLWLHELQEDFFVGDEAKFKIVGAWTNGNADKSVNVLM